MITLRTPLIKMFLPLHVHEVKFINKTVPLQQLERTVNRDPIDLWVNPAGSAKDLAGVQVLVRGFYHAEDGAPLTSHAETSGH